MHRNLYLVFFIFFIAPIAFAESTIDNVSAIEELTILSSGHKMSGLVYLAEGKGPKPTILLLHGYPGNEKNLDIAQAMRKRGWNVVFFHYRGSWGSEGEFSFLGSENDVQVVLEYILDEENAAKLKIDVDKISTVGHSMGGHMAIAGILDNPNVACSVAYDGANLGAGGVGFINDPNTEIPWYEYSDSLFMLKGWSGEKAVKEIREFGKELDLVGRVDRIKGRPVMLIAADTAVIPIKHHILPLYDALKATENSLIQYKLIEDDHSFSSSRDILVETTAKFLNENCTRK